MAMTELGVNNLSKFFGFNKVMAFPLFADFSIYLGMSKEIAYQEITVFFQIH